MTRPSGPSVNHLVLTVRDLRASHVFYTEQLGFEKCGELTGRAPPAPTRVDRGHESSHHDFALVQVKDPAGVPAAGPWQGFFPERAVGINHVAIGYPTREEWLGRIRHLRDNGVEFAIRGNHGMTHSAYISDPDGNGIEVLYELPARGAGRRRGRRSTTSRCCLNDSVDDDTDYHRFAPAE